MALLTTANGCADLTSDLGTQVIEPPYTNLVWQTNFSAGSIDASVWNFETGAWGWGNNELENYTNDAANAKVQTVEGRSMLVITALNEKGYTSARLNTSGKQTWTHGRIEARMKLPFGKGIWPAFWMLGQDIGTVGWPRCGEIDIMEMVGGEGAADSTVYGTIHYDAGGHQQSGGHTQLPSAKFSDSFHTFGVNWSQKQIVWYLDGLPYHAENFDATRSVFQNRPFYILLNLAVGGNWPGNPDETTTFPQKLIVDYVRVYQ